MHRFFHLCYNLETAFSKEEVHEPTASLYQLQQIDTEFLEKKERLSEVLKAQKETAELLAARQRQETAVADLATWQKQHKVLNQELDGVNNKARRSEQRLYSGDVTNPKELSDLQQEIEALGRRRTMLEDEILEAMIMVEDTEAEETEANSELEQIESAWQKSQSGLKQDQNELALRLHELTGLRKQQAAKISPEYLSQYEQLRKRRGGLAVAVLKLNTCQGCLLTVSANKVRQAQEGAFVYCGGCGRILYSR